MRKICTLICVSVISFAGFAVFMQSAQGQFASPEADGLPQVQEIDAPIVVETVTPEINLEIASIYIGGDMDTARYTPRLRINFDEFPLVSLISTEKADSEESNGRSANGRGARNGATTNVIIQRIQNRLRLPHIDLVVQDRVATVSGTVETERQRKLVESMLRFEPGINSVRNEITVASH